MKVRAYLRDTWLGQRQLLIKKEERQLMYCTMNHLPPTRQSPYTPKAKAYGPHQYPF
jgi:hypothetical protein